MNIEDVKPYEKEMVDLRSIFKKAKSLLNDDSVYDNWVEKNQNGICVDYLKETPIYHPDLALIFFGDDEMFFLSEKGTVLDRNLFKAYYLKGAIKGIKAYLNEYHLAPNKRLGDDFERWRMSITALYNKEEIFIAPFQYKPDIKLLGCRFVKDYFPNKMSLLGIQSIGYYSALTNRFEELFIEVPGLFDSSLNGNLKKEKSDERNDDYLSVNDFNNTDFKSSINFIESTIEEYLEVFKDNMSEKNYLLLVNSLKYYFNNGAFRYTNEIITFKSSPNVKKFGWMLKSLYHHVNGVLGTFPKNLPTTYLKFAKQHISIYQDAGYDENNHIKTTLYKYFHTKA
ncbi:hypothetical protein DHD32_01185 [Arenibacter sp. TNZ]|uniref:hypothetical protein n=1 Tax=Arenibacter TaxID=178469 RepID=UPI000CD41F57|nr:MULTISPECIES: hypothetical protein [Arenibacter]MCM4170077.1 hypothetical protein [Arenibacter sp. TNZ]